MSVVKPGWITNQGYTCFSPSVNPSFILEFCSSTVVLAWVREKTRNDRKEKRKAEKREERGEKREARREKREERKEKREEA